MGVENTSAYVRCTTIDRPKQPKTIAKPTQSGASGGKPSAIIATQAKTALGLVYALYIPEPRIPRAFAYRLQGL